MSSTIHHLYRSYVIGFVLSFILTSAAFLLTMKYIASDGSFMPMMLLVAILASLAVVQLVVQLVFFFHLGKESKPRLNTVSFLFMLMVVGIIGFGSLWIMYNLDYNMMGHDMDQMIIEDENIKPSTHHGH